MKRENLPEIIELAIRYVGSSFLVCGIVFGILNLIVLNQSNMRQTKIRFYLVAQSINDILVLGISCLDFILRYAFRTDLHQWTPFLCKLWPFLERSVRQLASWILVGISIERFTGCLLPLFYFTSKHKHRLISFIVAVLLLAGANSPVFYYNKLISVTEMSTNSTGSENHSPTKIGSMLSTLPNSTTKVCVLPIQYYSASYIVFFFIYWVLPFIFIISSNLYIGKWLHSRKRWLKQTPDMRITVPKTRSGMKRNFRESLKSIFILNTFCFICFTPLSICELSQLSRADSLIATRKVESIQEVYPVAGLFPASCIILQLFSYTFYAMKFAFYMCILTSFRKDFLNVLKKYLCCPGRGKHAGEKQRAKMHMNEMNGI